MEAEMISKILFASDYPLLRPDRLLGRIRLEGGLNEAELALALGQNAAHLFELENKR